jgi:Ca-activated chloride channel family protein
MSSRASTTGRRTAIGSAILESLDAIADVDDSVPPLPEVARPPRGATGAAGWRVRTGDLVLLTDGASNAGPLPVEAAAEAAARGIRIYTIGFGTEDPNSERPPAGCR